MEYCLCPNCGQEIKVIVGEYGYPEVTGYTIEWHCDFCKMNDKRNFFGGDIEGTLNNLREQGLKAKQSILRGKHPTCNRPLNITKFGENVLWNCSNCGIHGLLPQDIYHEITQHKKRREKHYTTIKSIYLILRILNWITSLFGVNLLPNNGNAET